MKVTLDLDKLLRQNRITAEEYARLKALAAADTGSLALNLLPILAGSPLPLVPSRSCILPRLPSCWAPRWSRPDRRWVVNLVAVFGSVHFYTQYLERLGAYPGTIALAGLAAIGIALALVRYNKSEGSMPPSRLASA